MLALLQGEHRQIIR